MCNLKKAGGQVGGGGHVRSFSHTAQCKKASDPLKNFRDDFNRSPSDGRAFQSILGFPTRDQCPRTTMAAVEGKHFQVSLRPQI